MVKLAYFVIYFGRKSSWAKIFGIFVFGHKFNFMDMDLLAYLNKFVDLIFWKKMWLNLILAFQQVFFLEGIKGGRRLWQIIFNHSPFFGYTFQSSHCSNQREKTKKWLESIIVFERKENLSAFNLLRNYSISIESFCR